MKRETASCIIKLTAIFVVFAGLILVSIVYFQIQSMNNFLEGMTGQADVFGELERAMIGAGSGFGRHSYTTPIVVTIWGLLLYALNRPLSLLVSKE